ncbi:3'-5' exonuclease [Arcobacter sp. 15-2]|uniref:3'-5' exonuclease n=1 Tax=Arcobacter sp. 15-2 TaxID=3374109 RepID=UPI00399CF180
MIKKIKQYFNKKKLTDDRFNYLLDEYEGDEYVCFDCETTGLNTKKDEIISIGAILIKDNKILHSRKFERFVKTEQALSAESIKIHHIRECDIENALNIDDVIYEFLDFVGNRPLVGYYLEFDCAMVNKYIKPKIGIKLPNKQYEVSEIYFDQMIKKTPGANIDLRFDIIMDRLNLPRLGKHDAINDVIMTAMIFLKLKK